MPLVTVKAANKTFNVSRHSQYKKNRGSKPLSPLNHERASCRSNSKKKNFQSVCDYSKNCSPVVKFVPADQLHGIYKENNPVRLFAEGTEIRVLNKTLSPVSSPHRFSNPLMPQFQSPLPVICKPIKPGQNESRTMSIKDALSVIESDLVNAVSPPNACSSFNLADSLLTDSEFKIEANISPQNDFQPRFTFFVKSNKVYDSDVNVVSSSTVFCPVTCSTSLKNTGEQFAQKAKKTLNCDTVTKIKAEVPPECNTYTSKIRTSRRRLLQKPNQDSGSGSSTNVNKPFEQQITDIPVINCDTNIKVRVNTTTSCDLRQLPPLLGTPNQPILKHNQTNPSPDQHNGICIVSESQTQHSQVLPSVISLDFPTYSVTTNQNRKRKSEEICQDNLSGLSFEVKKGCAFRQQPKKSCPDKRLCSKLEKTQGKSKGE